MAHKAQAGNSGATKPDSPSAFGQLLDALSANADPQDASASQTDGSDAGAQEKGKPDGGDSASPPTQASLILELSATIANLAKAAAAKTAGSANDNDAKTGPGQAGDMADASTAPLDPAESQSPDSGTALASLPPPLPVQGGDDPKAVPPAKQGDSANPLPTSAAQPAQDDAASADASPQANSAPVSTPAGAPAAHVDEILDKEAKAPDALASASTGESPAPSKSSTTSQPAKPQKTQDKPDAKAKPEQKTDSATALLWNWNATTPAPPSIVPVAASDTKDNGIANIGAVADASAKPASPGPAQEPGQAPLPSPSAKDTGLNGPQNTPQPDIAAAGTPAKPVASSGSESKPAADKPGLAVIQAPVAPQKPASPDNASLLVQNPLPAHGPADAPSVTQHVQVSPGPANIASLAIAIAAKSQSGNKEFEIRLDPPELGRVDVRLSIDQNGKAQASLAADQPRTLDLLRNDAPQLTRALRDAGLNVAQNGLNFSLRGQDRQSANSHPGARRPSLSLSAVSVIGAAHGAVHFQGRADGRLDIRV
jgi:flagellar hook-length control protein FliK